MFFRNLTNNIQDVANRFESYVNSLIKYYKLKLFKVVMKMAISVVNVLIYGSLIFFAFIFLSIGFALWIGTLFEYAFIGFLIVGGFYLFILLLMVVLGRKVIERKFLRGFSSFLFDDDYGVHDEEVKREIERFENMKERNDYKEF